MNLCNKTQNDSFSQISLFTSPNPKAYYTETALKKPFLKAILYYSKVYVSML